MTLCHRRFQSFIRSSDQNLVEQICNGSGKRWSGNLCTSNSSMLVYDVTVNTRGCIVTNVRSDTKYVYVACDIVVNQCLPVHYEKSTNQKPISNESCGPLAWNSSPSDKLSLVIPFCLKNSIPHINKVFLLWRHYTLFFTCFNMFQQHLVWWTQLNEHVLCVTGKIQDITLSLDVRLMY